MGILGDRREPLGPAPRMGALQVLEAPRWPALVGLRKPTRRPVVLIVSRPGFAAADAGSNAAGLVAKTAADAGLFAAGRVVLTAADASRLPAGLIAFTAADTGKIAAGLVAVTAAEAGILPASLIVLTATDAGTRPLAVLPVPPLTLNNRRWPCWCHRR